jgi:hypothetical protein
MKKFLRLAVCSVLLSHLHAGEEAKRVDWRKLTPAQLQEHVKNVKNFREMEELLGHSRVAISNAEWSDVCYEVGDSLLLVFSGEPENHFAKDDDLRKVTAILLYKRDAKGKLAVVWKMSKRTDPDRKFRSDYIDLPSEKGNSPNKS